MESRAEILAACDAGEGTRVVAVRYGVSESWVRRVKQQRREDGSAAATRVEGMGRLVSERNRIDRETWNNALLELNSING